MAFRITKLTLFWRNMSPSFVVYFSQFFYTAAQEEQADGLILWDCINQQMGWLLRAESLRQPQQHAQCLLLSPFFIDHSSISGL